MLDEDEVDGVVVVVVGRCEVFVLDDFDDDEDDCVVPVVVVVDVDVVAASELCETPTMSPTVASDAPAAVAHPTARERRRRRSDEGLPVMSTTMRPTGSGAHQRSVKPVIRRGRNWLRAV